MSLRRTKTRDDEVVNLIESSDEDIEAIDSDNEQQPAKRRDRPASATSSQRIGRGSLQLLASQRPKPPPSAAGTIDALFKSAAAKSRPRLQAAPAAPAASDPSAAAKSAAPHVLSVAAAAAHSSWEEVHAPKAEDELVVNKKKVQEVRTWLEYHQQPVPPSGAKLLLLAGPTGCGKSTVLRLLARQLHYELVEWTTPTPTLWTEHTYQDGNRLPYRSKLDEFEMFVTRSKFAALPLFSRASASPAPSSAPPSTTGSAPPLQQPSSSSSAPAFRARKLLVLDDLPHAADAFHRHRLVKAMTELVATARGPVVIIATEPGSAGTTQGSGASAAAGSMKGLHKDVLAALEAMGCHSISFNPVPPTSIAKHIKHIAAERNLAVDAATISSIAQVADGDLRSAVLTLQMMFLGKGGSKVAGGSSAAAAKSRARKGAAAGGSKRGRAAQEGAAAQAPGAEAVLAVAHRDMGLNLFHFLGKVLYNKRDGDDEQAGAEAAGGRSKSRKTSKAACASSKLAAQQQTLRQELMRPTLRYDPEAILQQSGMEALPVAAFLHENYPEFVEQGAMDDVAAAAGYLSDAAFLACYRNSAAPSSSSDIWGAEEGAAAGLMDAAAGSTAVRGLLFANMHPAPRRWLPLRSPVSGLVERAAAANLAALHSTMSSAVCLSVSRSCWTSMEAYASGVLVYVRQLALSPAYSGCLALVPPRWSHVWNGSVQERWQHGSASQVHTGWEQQQGALVEGDDGDDGIEDEIVED